MAEINSLIDWIVASLRDATITTDLLALFALCSFISIPITQYNDAYGDTVGYGLSTFFQTAVIRDIFPPERNSVADVLTRTVLFHGLRLASYLLIRDVTGWKPYMLRKPMNAYVRIPYALLLSVFYALLITPVLHVSRTPPKSGWDILLCWTGTLIALAGVLLEATADLQKYLLKLELDNFDVFYGPVGGVYRFCRHPNYAGEVMFWFGVWLAGLPSCCQSHAACFCCTAGFIGMSSIVLLEALPRVEKIQELKYRGQALYEQWRQEVPSVVPKVPSRRSSLESK